jgi:oligopeptide/dipeptide ABC transporter ATP-binding protein
VGGYKLHAVDDVNLNIDKGKTVGIVGESGCGKTTLGRTILGLLPATDGQVLFEGKDITQFNKKQLKSLRKEIQIIFQDPYSSINPRHSVGQIIEEPMIVNRIITNQTERTDKVLELMETVGLSEKLYNSYPHELDGGRRQRVGVARALSVKPKFIVCDEPVSALDVSIQAQILNLLMDLQEKMGLTYLFITHALSVAKHISDEIAVMYLGQCVERASSDVLFKNPKHPYTKALLSAILIPSAKTRETQTEIIKGELTSPINPKPGCRFYTRCPYRKEVCLQENLSLKEIEPGHFVQCTLYE